jgi:predicted pyridoxine 5'-phosphate oxidase superfamily flavin-nucleotide-binding protein
LCILVHVEEVYLHCARSFLRSKLWDPAHYMPREQMPSLARMVTEQTRPNDPNLEQAIATAEESIAEAYRCLY